MGASWGAFMDPTSSFPHPYNPIPASYFLFHYILEKKSHPTRLADKTTPHTRALAPSSSHKHTSNHRLPTQPATSFKPSLRPFNHPLPSPHPQLFLPFPQAPPSLPPRNPSKHLPLSNATPVHLPMRNQIKPKPLLQTARPSEARPRSPCPLPIRRFLSLVRLLVTLRSLLLLLLRNPPLVHSLPLQRLLPLRLPYFSLSFFRFVSGEGTRAGRLDL